MRSRLATRWSSCVFAPHLEDKIAKVTGADFHSKRPTLSLLIIFWQFTQSCVLWMDGWMDGWGAFLVSAQHPKGLDQHGFPPRPTWYVTKTEKKSFTNKKGPLSLWRWWFTTSTGFSISIKSKFICRKNEIKLLLQSPSVSRSLMVLSSTSFLSAGWKKECVL